jgi:hypothetical protein
MVDYYQILGIKPSASPAEIKSAYRRLARELHPDVNTGSEHASRDFSLLSSAYRTLIDPQERAYYDARREQIRSSGSVLYSRNVHAQRLRRATAQARWDRAVDLWIEAERRETYARTQAVFTTVTLFLSTFIVAMLKPRFWQNFDSYLGRTVLIALFLIGLWHLCLRLRDCLNRYTYWPRQLQGSVVDDLQGAEKPFTRYTAYSFLVFGYLISLSAGLFVGTHVHYIVSDMAFFFDRDLRLDLLFYPPIAVLIVDTMHTVASKIDA